MEPRKIVDFRRLGELAKRHRTTRDLSLREAAAEAGISASTLSRLERGVARPDFDTVKLLTDWLGLELEEVVVAANEAGRSSKAPRDRKRRKKTKEPTMADTLTKVEVHLRADPKLDDEAAQALVDVLRGLYPRFAKDRK